MAATAAAAYLLVTQTDVARSKAASPVPTEGRVMDDSGNDVGGLLLFVRDGRLDSLEVYSFDEPLPLPRVENVIWEHLAR